MTGWKTIKNLHCCSGEIRPNNGDHIIAKVEDQNGEPKAYIVLAFYNEKNDTIWNEELETIPFNKVISWIYVNEINFLM